MTIENLVSNIRKKKSFLCIGLDTDLDKIPPHLLASDDPIFEFNKAIIDATHDLAVAYKPNTAFYESYGVKGWLALEKTIQYLNQQHPEIFTIADAKRGDIGNTSAMYAKAFLTNYGFDSVTVAPYMGKDSVEPFLAVKNKFTILLALTSNAGSSDFQTMNEENPLFLDVLRTSLTWKNSENLMYVVGATKASFFKEIREIVPNQFLLVPGVGAQGGDLAAVCENGMNDSVGLLINSSREILYASADENFAQAARLKAIAVQREMQQILEK